MAIVVIATYSDVSASEEDKSWVYDEVLTQMHELRGELKIITGELVNIKEEIKQLKSSPRPQANLPDSIDIKTSTVLGDKAAKLAIVEIFDYQCPYCKRHHAQTFGKLKETYVDSGKIQYAVMDYPLSFHRQAESASIAARCAGEQGKYWEMHSELLGENSVLSESRYLELAKTMDLDSLSYQACLGSDEIKQQVQASASYSEKLGVRGTPAFFIGKVSGDKISDVKMLAGAQPYDRFASVIEGMLKEN